MKTLLIILSSIVCFTAFALQEEPRNTKKKFTDTLFKDTMYKKGIDDTKEIKRDSSRAKPKGRSPKQK